MTRRGVFTIALALTLAAAPCASAATKSTPKKRITTTTKKPAKTLSHPRLVNMCSLLSLIKVDDLIADTHEPIKFSVQANGGATIEGEWMSQNLVEIAKDRSSSCGTVNGIGPLESQVELWVTQQHNGLDGLLSSRPTYRRGVVDGIAQPTWIDRHGAELTADGQLRKTAGCFIAVVATRGVFGAYWTPWRSLETDPGKISCSVAEELVRRELAALDAGGYTYLPAV